MRCPSCGEQIQIPELDAHDEAGLARWTSAPQGDAESDVVIAATGTEDFPVELLKAPRVPRITQRNWPVAGIVVALLALGAVICLSILTQPSDPGQPPAPAAAPATKPQDAGPAAKIPPGVAPSEATETTGPNVHTTTTNAAR